MFLGARIDLIQLLEKTKMRRMRFNLVSLLDGPEGVKWEWNWPKIWVGKWDLIHWDWDFCTGNGTQNIKWEWEFCFNPLSKKDFFRIKFKQKSNNSVMEFYPIKKIGKS